MNSKISKVIGDFLKKEFIPFFGTEAIKFLSLDFDTESETYNKLLEHLSQKYDETYVNVAKKRSPHKTPKKEETDVDLTYEEYVEKQKKNPDDLLCSWIFGRGDKANKHCGRVVTNKDAWSSKQIDDYEVRCDKCKRNNTEKANATNKGRYLKIKIGNQVKGTPTPGVSLPESENDVPSMHSITGLKDGIVSPTPENFLTGQDTGNVTPTKAKKRKSPATLKIKPIKNGDKDDHTDYRSSQEINGYYILVRKNHDEDEFTFGGKFENEEDMNSNLYIQGVIQLDEDDLSKIEKYSYKYKYCGASKKKSPEIPEIPDLDDEEENVEEEENVDDLLAGLDVN